MKIRNVLALLWVSCIAAFFWVGCNDNTEKYDFPKDIRDMCIIAREGAKSCIEQALNVKLNKEPGTEVKKVMTCDRRASSGYWCWYDPVWKFYVGGECGNGWIKVGCNPKTGGEVYDYIVKHEFGHYWLDANNIGGGTHYAPVKNCFFNWSGPSASEVMQLRVLNTLASNETWISLDTVEKDNTVTHHDFVVFKN